MLTPDVLEYILNSLNVHKNLQESVIRDIVRRIIKSGLSPADNLTETTVYQAGILQKAGIVYRDIIKIIAEESDNLYYDVKNAFEAAGIEIFNYDEETLLSNGYDSEIVAFLSVAMKKLWDAALEKTFTEATNLTKTIALTSQTAFISACDLAHMQIASGAFTYGQAIASAAKQASVQGVNVLYPSGASAKLDYAIRRAVLTGVNQTAAKMTEMKADELNHDLMETSAHYGARAEHAEWQGQVVSRSGAPGYLTLADVGYGDVTGIFGANCRHNWFMYFGVPSYTPQQLEDMKNKTVTYNGQEMSVYEARKKQRGFERHVKSTKRELIGLDEAMKNVSEADKVAIKAEFQSSAVKLKQQEARLNDFCKKTGLKRDSFREQVFTTETENEIRSWTKSISQKAVWGNRKALISKSKNDIIITNSSALRIPQISSSTITHKVNSGEYNLKLSKQHYAKHIEGMPQYEQYKTTRLNKGGNPQSKLAIDYNEAQSIITKKSGTGIVDVTRDGHPRNVEYVSCNKVIGYYYGNGEYHETTKGAIHYGKRSTHIVPVKGDFYD